MPGIDGLEVLESIKRQRPHIAVIILTGYASVDNAVHALRHGALNYLQKPASSDEVLDSVEEALTRAHRERERTTVLRKAQQLLSEGLRQLDEVTPGQIDLIAEADASEQTPDDDRFVKRGPLVVDIYRRKATLNGDLVDLTAGEYDLLLCLVQEAPRVLGPQELVERTRGYECSLAEAREIIRWQVYLLRQKVEVDPSAPQMVLNVRGRGYMWAGV
jgi:DNA-binding response OmpR family regulator